jgi:hypothetical protein
MTIETKRIEEIKTHPTFESLFPINPVVLEKIQQDMVEGRYDLSQPIIMATWEGQSEPVCIDGHTRLRAAINAGIEQVPAWLHEFDTEQEAVEKAIKLQRNRRNMTDAELLTCMEKLDRKKSRGGDRRSEEAKSKVQGCTIENERSQSAQITGELLGISERKVKQARTVMDHADEATVDAVKLGDLSINQAYEATQKKRRDKKGSKNESSSGALWPVPALKATTEPDRSRSSKNDPSTSLGKSVTVYLPDWQYDGLTNLCDGYIESHVRKAVDLYVESLGIQEEVEDDDDEYFDPADFDED